MSATLESSKVGVLLAHQVGGEVSVNELATQLQLARPTADRYLDLLARRPFLLADTGSVGNGSGCETGYRATGV